MSYYLFDISYDNIFFLFLTSLNNMFILFWIIAAAQLYNEKVNQTQILWKAFSNTLQDAGKIFWDQIQYLEGLCVLIYGKTGVGKSKLINSIFNGIFAEEALGKPVTKTIHQYSHKDYPISIYDTPGLEIDPKKQKTLRKDLSNLIKQKYKTKDKRQFIHCIWYCIQCGSRIEDAEIKFIQELSKQYSCQIPFIIILTQCYNNGDKEEMIKILENENLGIPIIPVVAEKKDYGSFTVQSFGLDKLILQMKDSLSEIIYHTQKNGDIVPLQYSRKLACMPISIGSVAAYGIGFVPFPYGKATAIGLINILMVKKIADIYGITVLGDTVSEIITNTFKECIFAGDNTFEIPEKLKVFLESFNEGGEFFGLTAASATATLGIAYSYISELRCKSRADSKYASYDDFQNQINDLFNHHLNEKEKEIFQKINS